MYDLEPPGAQNSISLRRSAQNCNSSGSVVFRRFPSRSVVFRRFPSVSVSFRRLPLHKEISL